MKLTTRAMVFSAVVGAMYVALTFAGAPYAFGLVQIRVSEALTLLPFLFPETMWGLFVGCALSNTISQFGLPDIIFGSLATLLAGYLTSKCRVKWLAPIPPIVINAVVVGALITVYTPDAGAAAFPLIAGQIGLEELVVCVGLGLPMLAVLQKTRVREKLHL